MKHSASEGPRRNRVTPLGDIVAIALRGNWLGNRGRLHEGTEIVRFHSGTAWITCALHYKDWQLAQWAPRHYTILFFHDEAVSLAAGHRPCALCRRPAYRAFGTALAAATGGARPAAGELDRALHNERLIAGTHRRRLHERSWTELPAGGFVLLDDGPALVLPDAVVPWTMNGYAAQRIRPANGRVTVITPPSALAAITAGYPVQIDETALDARAG